MSNKLFDSTIGALNTSLNARMVNQNVINSNIANADTPNYKAKKLEFETALREALDVGEGIRPEQTHAGHQVPKELDPIHPEIVEDPNGVESLDGNTVDRSAEMAKSTENQIMYNASVELLKKKLGMLKYGISEGGGSN
ncbi:MAG: flagellar basal body rod protein FlgB [Bacteriovoracia bacterium]